MNKPLFAGPKRELCAYVDEHPERADDLVRRARQLGTIQSPWAAVQALMSWDGTLAAARRPAMLAGELEELQEAAPELPDRERNIAGIGELRAAAFGSRGDTDTGPWQDGARGYEEAAEA